MRFSLPRPEPGSRAEIALCALAIAVALALAYANSFSGPFIFDDTGSIVRNPTIRHWVTSLSPPADSGLTVSGRPLLNFSLAVNRSISGLQAWSYHLVNLLVHLAATLALFGVVRRTLRQNSLRARFGAHATLLAAATALLWGLHPLQTESTTYIVQRAESLAGLCYLLTLYGFIRATSGPAPRLWFLLSIGTCFLGMAAKEIMVSAPVIILLYDGLLVAPGWWAALRLRWRYYLALASSWLLLALLIWQTGNRGGTAGLVDAIPWGAYALTQCEAIPRYLALSLFPAPLTLDYGVHLVDSWTAVWLQMILLAGLATTTMVALWRRLPCAFPLVWFFAILAPTSSVIPVITQTMAEHRMYLPLAGLMALLVLGLFGWLKTRSFVVFAGLALVFAGLTFQRNFAYRTEMSIWSASVATWPTNARAWNNLGRICYREGRLAEALNCYTEAHRLKPQSPDILSNLGSLLAEAGQHDAAIARFQEALRVNPNHADSHLNWGLVLFRRGDVKGSIFHFCEGARLDSSNPKAYKMLAEALRQAGREAEASMCLTEAARLEAEESELSSPSQIVNR